MSFIKPRALVISGEGVHGEQETAQAFRLARFNVDIISIHDLICDQVDVHYLSLNYSVVAFPGGFTFADHLGAGKVFALKIQYQLKWDLSVFISRGGLVIGICNGFQILIRLGIFGKDFSITRNSGSRYLNTWVRVTPSPSKCIWLKGLGTMELPIRHSMGKIVISPSRRVEALEKLERFGIGCLRYEDNLNGSEESLAALCDPSGRMFGLMPHPESFVRWSSHPEWTIQTGRASAPGQGLMIFENAYQEALTSR